MVDLHVPELVTPMQSLQTVKCSALPQQQPASLRTLSTGEGWVLSAASTADAQETHNWCSSRTKTITPAPPAPFVHAPVARIFGAQRNTSIGDLDLPDEEAPQSYEPWTVGPLSPMRSTRGAREGTSSFGLHSVGSRSHCNCRVTSRAASSRCMSRSADMIIPTSPPAVSFFTAQSPRLSLDGVSEQAGDLHSEATIEFCNCGTMLYPMRLFSNASKPVLRRHHTPAVFPCALPQMARDMPVWPERWGMTRLQVDALLKRLREDPAWKQENSVYTLVSDFIIPWTAGTGLGYALLQNEDEPKEVNVMVSHAWGENAEEFLEAVLRSTTSQDIVFICCLSLYQAEDGDGPSIVEQLGAHPSESPFQRVLENIRSHGKSSGWPYRWRWLLIRLPVIFAVLAIASFYVPALIWGCSPCMNYCAQPLVVEPTMAIASQDYTLKMIVAGTRWKWVQQDAWFLIFSILAIVFSVSAIVTKVVLPRFRIYSGRMVVVPNREVDIYSRLWCVYEIFVATRLTVPVEVAHTLAFAGKVSSSNATCGSDEDAQRIKGEILAGGHTYSDIDRDVFRTVHRSRTDAIRASAFSGLCIAMSVAAALRIRGVSTEAAQAGGGIFLACIIIIACVYRTFRRQQGVPSALRVALTASSLLVIGVSMEVVRALTLSPNWLFIVFLEFLGKGIALGGIYIGLFLVLWFCVPKRLDGYHWQWPTISCIAVLLFGVLIGIQGELKLSWDVLPTVIGSSSCVLAFFVAPMCTARTLVDRWGLRISSRAC